ncbi:MAG: hypothetical protein OEM01_08740, partial [Desulfobulbaceae bacterium]|nr:hypothetical protein [Desulfobulbaceae bacterium]
FITLVQEKFQMSIFFCRKIKRLIHWPEKHVRGLSEAKLAKDYLIDLAAAIVVAHNGLFG